MTRLLSIIAVFGLVSATTLTAEATPRRTRIEYVVTESHPRTGGVISTRRYANRDQATQQHDALRSAHWVQWRFMGINEPMRYQRFKTAGEAQNFINTDGPSKTGKLGIALLTDETKMLRSNVTLREIVVPVTGGGNGGGNGNQGQVIDTIDRIIGIIGR